jgi:hypothetical protein
MEQPPNQNYRRNNHQAKDLVALVPFPLPFATRGGVKLCEVRLGARVDQLAILPGCKAR